MEFRGGLLPICLGQVEVAVNITGYRMYDMESERLIDEREALEACEYHDRGSGVWIDGTIFLSL